MLIRKYKCSEYAAGARGRIQGILTIVSFNLKFSSLILSLFVFNHLFSSHVKFFAARTHVYIYYLQWKYAYHVNALVTYKGMMSTQKFSMNHEHFMSKKYCGRKGFYAKEDGEAKQHGGSNSQH